MKMNKNIDFAKKQNYIFDMDGTLVDSMYVWDNLLIDFLAKRGYETPDDLLREVACMSMEQSSAMVSSMFDLGLTAPEIYAEWRGMIYDGYAYDIKLKPGAKEFLARLKQHNKSIVLATANSQELSEVCLKSNGIFEYFDSFVYADDVGCGKSSPNIYRTALESIHGKPSDSVLFEDIFEALKTAHSIGLDVVIVEDASSSADRDALMKSADIYIKDFTELISAAEL